MTFSKRLLIPIEETARSFHIIKQSSQRCY
jgi:hypothetical protein